MVDRQVGSDSRDYLQSTCILRRHIGMSASVCTLHIQIVLEKVWAFTKYVAVSLVVHVGHVYFSLRCNQHLLPEMYETHCFSHNMYVHM